MPAWILDTYAKVVYSRFTHKYVKTICYISQHIWCLSQARINWEGCVRKGILRKNDGDGRGGGHQLVWIRWQSIQTNWCPHLCHSHHFYAGCPSLHNPPNLSWLGTGTKYAGCILSDLVSEVSKVTEFKFASFYK